MAISFVRQTGTPVANGGNSATITLTVGASGAAAGNLLVATIGWSSTFKTIGAGSITDTAGNTWNVVNQVRNTGSNANVAIAYSVLTTGLSSGNTIVCNFGATVSAQSIGVEEYTGNTSTPFDVSANSGTVSGTAVNPGTTASTSSAEEMIVVAEAHIGAQTQTAGAGYTGRSNPSAGAGGLTSFSEEKQVSATGTYGGANQMTLSGAINYAAVVATFAAQASGSSPVNTVAPAISGTASLGNTLTVSDGTWSNSPTSITYQWQRSSNSGSSWVNCTNFTSDGGNPTTNTHTVVGFDVGSMIRCVVTASNASGVTSANSNTTSDIAPTAGAPSYRMVALPVTQTDNQAHSIPLTGAVLPNETMVLLASTSVGSISGDMGTVTDPAGNTWTLDHDSGAGPGNGHITQAFSAQNGGSKLNIGTSISNAIKQALVVGAHALNSTSIVLDHNPGFDPGGSALVIGVGGPGITYTGITGSTLTGVSAHAALVGGETILYHGQSPYYTIYALNPGDGSASRMAYDGSDKQHATTGVPSAGPIVTTKNSGIAFTLSSHGGADINNWMTPGSGWTVDFAGYQAVHFGQGANLYDAFGINYAGESGYKIGVQTKPYSASGTSITGNYTTDEGAAAFQDTMVIAYGFNATVSAPTNTVAPVVTGTINQGQNLSTTNGTWTNSPTSFGYQWQRDVAGNAVFSNISAANASSYSLVAGDVGNNVRCVVTATNTGGSASANSNAVGPIGTPIIQTFNVAIFGDYPD